MLAVGLSACSLTTIAPIEQVQKVAQDKKAPSLPKSGRDSIKQQPTIKYMCDGNKIVRLQPSSKKKNSTVTVIFNRTSYKLSPTVSDKGKKYSNIRWIWLEGFNGKGMLSDNRNKILATNCVKK